jgi:hypothetical protein
MQAHDDKSPMSFIQKTSAAAEKVISATSISHDLPTPPISEGGDDIGSKDKPAESSGNVSNKAVDAIQALNPSQTGTSSAMPHSTWKRNR